MADLEQSFRFTMQHEDRQLSGTVTKDPSRDDPNAVARFGINSSADPQAVADGFYTMDHDAALEYAGTAFKYNYFAPMCGYAIKDQDVANKLIDFAFNMGRSQATKIVQRALNAVISGPVVVDGIIGQHTVDAINAADPAQLLAAIKEKAKEFYVSLASANPEDEKFLNGWIARAEA